nr:Crp/Fnr family transcriptional regulator [Aridibaculum aurantiacum]
MLKNFTSHREIQKCKKKQQVYLEGNRPAKLFYIKKGKVKTFKTNEEGKELVIGLYKEGDFLGYRALLENSKYKETAEAMEDTELAIIPRHEFEVLISGDHAFSTCFIKMMATYISETEDHLAGLAYNSLRKKVAEALIMLQKKYKNGNENYRINLTRDNLASIAGTATESLIRTLGDFKSEHLIEIEGGAITIINEKKLENLHN